MASRNHLLSKVVERKPAERAVTMMEKIAEEEVEVANLILEQDERLLNKCSWFFMWILGMPLVQIFNTLQGLILPVCPKSADEDFWLFYTVQTPSKFTKASENYQLKRHWFNIEEKYSTNYCMIAERALI